MANGLSLHLGLNSVDASHYGGWDGQLAACEFDARDMAALAKKQGFKGKTLLTKKATADAAVAAIRDAAKKLHTGDIFFLTYSGHGGQVPDTNGDDREDNLDETWVLYDRELIDDELYALWSAFEIGVRILVLSDSCHSGTVTRFAEFDRIRTALNQPATPTRGMPAAVKVRAMPRDVAERTYQRNKRLYDGIQKDNPAGSRAGVAASVLLISGCQDSLLRTWNKGAFQGGYKKFHGAIQAGMPLYQQPNYFLAGRRDIAFERQTPFTV